jgi:hypothetical protein
MTSPYSRRILEDQELSLLLFHLGEFSLPNFQLNGSWPEHLEKWIFTNMQEVAQALKTVVFDFAGMAVASPQVLCSQL